DRRKRLDAHQVLWTVRYLRGEFAAALRHLDEGEALYDPVEDRKSGLVLLHDAKAAALSDRSLVLWMLGHIDRALEVNRQAVEYARMLEHPISLAFVLTNAAVLRVLRRESDACRAQAETALAYATEQGIAYWVPYGMFLRGWARAEQGELEQGITDLEQGLASMIAMGSGLWRSFYYASFAAAQARAGHAREARDLIERAKVWVAATGERNYEAEIHRLDAEVTLAEAGGADRVSAAAALGRAEALLETAIECAGRQGARTFELRATTTPARLRGRREPGARGRARLAEPLGGFR